MWVQPLRALEEHQIQSRAMRHVLTNTRRGLEAGVCGVRAVCRAAWEGRGHFHWTLTAGVKGRGPEWYPWLWDQGGQGHGGREGLDCPGASKQEGPRTFCTASLDGAVPP